MYNALLVDVESAQNHLSGKQTYQALAAPRENPSHFLDMIHYGVAFGFRVGILKTGTTDEAISTPL